jgi:dephospho-CoA kinase
MTDTNTIIPSGGPGSGKSTVANFLIDGKDSNRFKASDTTNGGET